ncbi:hypothetical protein [Streptomyces sp. NRRL F-2664]|uniref:hypothetical protein n=1 Tax=Streptomyces sp. NRRL F-2664 TaxID=1463842 RepID=UPI00131B2630|nr:hypothetical protein [Streptomyces sp. NRRL F-2664]
MTITLSVLFGVLLLAALALHRLGGASSPLLTEEDVIGTWHGDRGARLEVMADGRVHLSGARDWVCVRGGELGAFTGDGGWTLGGLPDEDPGIRVSFSPAGTPETCTDWFSLHGTGGDSAEDGSDVWATFLSRTAGAERFRRAPTG